MRKGALLATAAALSLTKASDDEQERRTWPSRFMEVLLFEVPLTLSPAEWSGRWHRHPAAAACPYGALLLPLCRRDIALVQKSPTQGT